MLFEGGFSLPEREMGGEHLFNMTNSQLYSSANPEPRRLFLLLPMYQDFGN